MAFQRKNSEPRSGEMTSMIDVIFLLLIFFLVTLNPMPSEKAGETQESVISLRVPEVGEGYADADLLIQLQNIGGKTRYYVFDPVFINQANWSAIQNVLKMFANQPNQLVSMLASLNMEKSKAQLNEVLRGKNLVLIRASDWVEYGDVMDIIDRFQKVNPQGKYFSVSGNVWDVNIRFLPKIKEHFEES